MFTGECRSCWVSKVEITTFEDNEKHYLTRTVCPRPQVISKHLRCGFYDFCKDCERRFLCATERK